MNIHLITCTGDRPEAFTLCRSYVERWRAHIPLHWIVVDDGKQCVPSVPAWADYRHVKRPSVQGHTLASNLQLALDMTEGAHDDDAIFFVEDDDYYGSDYLAGMLAQLDRGFLAVGQCRARYYNIRSLRYRVHANTAHASLAQTAFRCLRARDLVQAVVARAQLEQRTDIDVLFWHEARALSLNTFLFPETFSFVGMKGLPGREGIGVGHRPPVSWSTDTQQLFTLQYWIGNAFDFETYRRLICATQFDLPHNPDRLLAQKHRNPFTLLEALRRRTARNHRPG